ncbi:hypothetical protein EBU71_19820 [bacterium]|nr:hypothetical protein [Candidatus Elulimicrobium humile]
MATFTKLALQPAGTTGTGLGIKVAATATAGTAVHTASTTTTTIDEIWLYAVNTSSSSVKLTIEWGEATAPDGNIELTVLPEAGLVTVIPGLVLQGNATARVVRAFAATANVVVVHGFVNRISV